MEERITELEIRSSFQDEKLRLLNDALYAQQKELDKLAARLRVTEQRLARLAGASEGEAPASDEQPPHY